MPADVFISYSSNDQDKVVKLADKLRTAGVSIWVDESGIGAATLWSKEIAGAIKGCKVLVLMVTPNSVTSKNVVKEVSLAAEQNKQILPVILEPTQIPEALEYHLAGIQHLDVSGMSAPESAEEILPALQRLLGLESEEVNAVGHAVRASRRRSVNIWSDWKLYACVFIAVAVGWFSKTTPPIPDAPESLHVEQVLKGTNSLRKAWGNPFVLSPNGKKLVYALNRTGSRLHLLSLADGVDREIPGTEDGWNPFFSPDGQSVGFSTLTELKTVDLQSGDFRTLASYQSFTGRGAAWRTDKIVYSPTRMSGLSIVNSDGGQSTTLTELEAGELDHRWPQWLPDGKYVLFMTRKDGNPVLFNVEVVKIATGKRMVLEKDCLYARYAASGHLLYAIDGNLYAREIDLDELELKGTRTMVLQGLGLESNRRASVLYTVSDGGTLAYLSGGGGVNRKFIWLDMQGNTMDASITKEHFQQFDLSPDDNMVAVQVDHDIQLLDLDTDFSRAFTLRGTTNSFPVWTPDGQSIVFGTNRDGKWGVLQKKVTTTEKAYLFPPVDYQVAPTSFSTNGMILVGGSYWRDTQWDGWGHTIGQTNKAVTFIVQSAANENWPMLSPNGEWLSYISDGQLNVKRYGAEGWKIRMPIVGPVYRTRWSRSGDKIFYETEGVIWSIPITQEDDTIRQKAPSFIVKLPPSSVPWQWDISSDEKRFLVMVEDVEDEDRPTSLNSINIIFNFFTELNEKVPVGKE